MAAPRPTRRTLFALPLIAASGPALAAPPRVVTVLGDSITAGYGLPAAQALPAQLHLALTRLGVANVVRAAGVSGDTIVEQVFREVRAFRIYDGPTEVHKWSLAKKVKRDWKAAQG